MFIPHLFAGSIEGLNSVSVCWTLVVSLTKFPTAQAWPELGSAAAASRIFWSELGLGLETILQLVPFHCSMSVCSPTLEITNPTAQMSEAETMATPLRRLFPVRFGLATTLHCVPFHCSISVWEVEVLSRKSPTAQTSVAETTVTPLRTLSRVPPFGLETTLHVWPFQCSVSVLVLLNSPTAQTSVEETAVTPNRKLLPLLPFGLVTTLQLEPFQCSISVLGISWALLNHPTAQTSFVAMAVTPRRPLWNALGLGLATMLHCVPFQCSISV